MKVQAAMNVDGFEPATFNVERRPEPPAALEDDLTGDERNLATFLHLLNLSAFVGLPLVGFIPQIIIWMMKKDESPYVDDHGKEALNFHISMVIWMAVAGISILVCIGAVLVPVLFIVWFVTPILNAIRANKGEYVRYPITIRFFS